MSDNIDFISNFRNLTNNQIMDSSFIVNPITKEEVDSLDLRNVDYIFDRLKQLKKSGKGKMIITFSGYDDCSEEIYEIEKIRKYVNVMFQKHPYMFYFINQVDSTYKAIWSCLCDIQSYAPSDKKDMKDVVFRGEDISKVFIQCIFKKDITKKFIYETLKYGNEVGDSESSVNRVISNIVNNLEDSSSDEIKRINESKDDIREDLFNLYEDTAMAVWKEYVNYSNVVCLPEFAAVHYLYQIKNSLKQLSQSSSLLTHIPFSERQLTNLFYIREAYNERICRDCGSPHTIVFKSKLDDVEDAVFLPSFESYYNYKLLPVTPEFMGQAPIPVNYKKDKWICPNCLKMHSFSYSNIYGLQFYEN